MKALTMKTILLICTAALACTAATLRAADEPAPKPEPAIDAGNLRTFVELVRTGRVDEARELLRTCLSSSSV